MHVREARDEDIPAMSELLGVLFTQESEFTPDTERHKTGLRAILKDSTRGQLLVLEDEGKVVGMLNLLFLPSTALGITVGLLEDVVVKPTHRGCGGGALLMRRAIALAKAKGLGRLTLLTDSGNEAAQRFYTRHGFVGSAMRTMRLEIAE